MVDWADFERTATTWSLLAAGDARVDSWLERAVARAAHMAEWHRGGGCGVCRRAAVFPLRPPFCDECWAGRIVRLARPQDAQRAAVLPVTLSVDARGAPHGLHFDRHETGALPLQAPLVRAATAAPRDPRHRDDVDE